MLIHSCSGIGHPPMAMDNLPQHSVNPKTRFSVTTQARLRLC